MFEPARVIAQVRDGSRPIFDPVIAMGNRLSEARWLHSSAVYSMETADWSGVVRKLEAMRLMLDEAVELHKKVVGNGK